MGRMQFTHYFGVDSLRDSCDYKTLVDLVFKDGRFVLRAAAARRTSYLHRIGHQLKPGRVARHLFSKSHFYCKIEQVFL